MLLYFTLGLSLSPLAEVVYVKNQRLETYQVGGKPVVQLSALRELLTAQDNKMLSVKGESLFIADGAGDIEKFLLTPYGELVEWEAVLSLLGYQRKTSKATGIVDWISVSSGASVTLQEPGRKPGNDELEERLERSRRRLGFRVAEKNYLLVMDKLGLAEDSPEQERLERIGFRVVAQTPLANFFWTFAIADTPVPNALCTGEGFVIVTKGLLDIGLSDDELAGVLGHEVAHGVRRHPLSYMERFEEVQRLGVEIRRLDGLAARASEDSDSHKLQLIKSRMNSLAPRLNYLADYIKNQQSYSQKEEEEADVLGMQYAANAGFNPNGEARALLKLQARSVELFGQAYAEGTRTHPPLERRLEIQALVQKRWKQER